MLKPSQAWHCRGDSHSHTQLFQAEEQPLPPRCWLLSLSVPPERGEGGWRTQATTKRPASDEDVRIPFLLVAVRLISTEQLANGPAMMCAGRLAPQFTLWSCWRQNLQPSSVRWGSHLPSPPRYGAGGACERGWSRHYSEHSRRP